MSKASDAVTVTMFSTSSCQIVSSDRILACGSKHRSFYILDVNPVMLIQSCYYCYNKDVWNHWYEHLGSGSVFNEQVSVRV